MSGSKADGDLHLYVVRDTFYRWSCFIIWENMTVIYLYCLTAHLPARCFMYIYFKYYLSRGISGYSLKFSGLITLTFTEHNHTDWTFLSSYPADTSVHPSATTFLIVHTRINIQQHTSFVVLTVTDGSHQSAKHICRLVVDRKRHDWYKAEISALETDLRSSAVLQAQIRSVAVARYVR